MKGSEIYGFGLKMDLPSIPIPSLRGPFVPPGSVDLPDIRLALLGLNLKGVENLKRATNVQMYGITHATIMDVSFGTDNPPALNQKTQEKIEQFMRRRIN
jgi:hypothetical protein